MSKRYHKNYLGVLKDYCPKCGKIAERIGVYYNKILKSKYGWNCENCGFKEIADQNLLLNEKIEATLKLL